MERKSFISACAATSVLGAAPAIASADQFEYDLATPTGTIFGTLAMPARIARGPVVLIIAGSGPTDRDGNGPMLKLETYRKLATALFEHGVASVRYDKRGIAASHAAQSSEADIRFDAYVDDAAAWIAKLRADGRFSRVIVAGHSEGSLIGMIAVRHVPADAYLSLEGAGFPADVVLGEQLRTRLQPYPDLAAQAPKIIAALKNGTTVGEGDVPAPLMPLFRPSVQPYLISWFKYDPRVEIAKLATRVTIVQGTHDIQVPVADGKALAAACPSATFVLIEGMTHVLTDDPGTTLAAQTSGAYADVARTLDATLVHTLVTAAIAS